MKREYWQRARVFLNVLFFAQQKFCLNKTDSDLKCQTGINEFWLKLNASELVYKTDTVVIYLQCIIILFSLKHPSYFCMKQRNFPARHFKTL